MRIHDLKTDIPAWSAVACGKKTFEVRKNDRDYKVGDALLLRAWDAETQTYNGGRSVRFVEYVLEGGQYGIVAGYVVMGLRKATYREFAEVIEAWTASSTAPS